MAEDDLDDELEEGDEDQADDEEEVGGPSGIGGKRKLLILIAVVLLLVLGGLAAAYFTGLLQPLIDAVGGGGEGESTEDAAVSGNAVFLDLPELLVNLNTGGRKSSVLKIRVALELSSAEEIPKIEEVMPRIIDAFQVYLRELRIEDLKGSAGMYRLREELLTRVSAAVAPVKVNDILFKEMLVQR